MGGSSVGKYNNGLTIGEYPRIRGKKMRFCRESVQTMQEMSKENDVLLMELQNVQNIVAKV